MAPAFLKHLLTSFSPKGDYLAVCAGDGRIKTWDTVTGSVKADFADLATSTPGTDATENGHLSVDYTCMTWNPAVKKGKKKHSSFLIGLGTGSGDVLLLDSALGQLKWKLRDCHPGGVKALTFSNSGSIIYSTGVDGMVCELEVETGKLLQKFRASKRSVTCLAISKDDKYLVTGSSDLRLFDLSTKKRLAKFTGHPDAVKALVYTEDGKHLLSSATGERHVAFWKHDGGKKNSAAVCSLSMEHPAISLDCRGDFSTKLRVVAVSEVGVAYVWNASNIEELAKLDPIKISIDLKDDTTKNVTNISSGILAAKFVGKNNEDRSGSVLVAFGTTVKPSFERLSLEGRNSDILLQATQDGTLLSSEAVPASEKKDTSEAKILGADNAVDIDNARPHIEFEETPTKPSKKKKRASLEETPNIDMDRTTLLADGQEETMEEKLKKLGILGDGDEDNIDKEVSTLKADSLQVLLTQALESEDKALLEKCLIVTNEKVILRTMQNLASSNAARFLQMSVFQIDSRTRRSLLLVPWIKAALLYHASYIMSNPSMQPVLSFLYQVIEARISVYRPLLSLSGRLDLITAQISANQIKPDKEASGAVVYEESDDDNGEDDDDADEGEVEDVMDTDDVESASDESDEDLGNKKTPLKQNDSDGSADPMMEDDDF